MTSPRLDLEGYGEALALLEPLASLVRDLKAEHEARAREVDAARNRCAASYAVLGTALDAYRYLTAALVEGAGTDGRYELDHGLALAHDLLDPEIVDTAPL